MPGRRSWKLPRPSKIWARAMERGVVVVAAAPSEGEEEEEEEESSDCAAAAAAAEKPRPLCRMNSSTEEQREGTEAFLFFSYLLQSRSPRLMARAHAAFVGEKTTAVEVVVVAAVEVGVEVVGPHKRFPPPPPVVSVAAVTSSAHSTRPPPPSSSSSSSSSSVGMRSSAASRRPVVEASGAEQSSAERGGGAAFSFSAALPAGAGASAGADDFAAASRSEADGARTPSSSQDASAKHFLLLIKRSPFASLIEP